MEKREKGEKWREAERTKVNPRLHCIRMKVVNEQLQYQPIYTNYNT